MTLHPCFQPASLTPHTAPLQTWHWNANTAQHDHSTSERVGLHPGLPTLQNLTAVPEQVFTSARPPKHSTQWPQYLKRWTGFVVLGGMGEDQHVLRYCGHVVLCLHSKKGERDCDKFVQPLFLVGVRIKSYSNLWLVTLHSCFQPASLTPHTAPLYLYTKLCAEKSHPLLWLNFPETSHDSLKNSIYQSLGLTFSSLA